MNAIELLQDLTSKGFTLRVLDGGQLAVSPKLPADVRQMLKKLKPDILIPLTSPDPWPTLNRCPHCHGIVHSSEAEGWVYDGCKTDPSHYDVLKNKRPREPMGFFLERREDIACR